MTPEQVRRLYRRQKSASGGTPVPGSKSIYAKKSKGCGCGKKA
ncbi:hypothetical protein J2S78_003162 [Salibacterium salarium]|nr:hypothetical protein [Salibacterium salarium]